MEFKNVSVIGLWHLGMITATGLADYGHKVTGIDSNSNVITNLMNGKPPIFEPGLAELTGKDVSEGRLSFTTDYKSGLKDSECVVIAFDTPIDANDRLDLTVILQSIRQSIPYLKENCLLVIASQVPIGTCEKIKIMIKKERPDLEFGLVCIPENLRLGEAVTGFKSPDLIVIGADKEEDMKRAEQLYGFIPGEKVKRVSLKTAEMVKHAINSFLANQMSFSNELGNICDLAGVDWAAVSDVLHMEPRIGKKAPLRAGLAFSGGTIARDVNVLRELGKENGMNTIFLDAIMDVNKNQNGVVIDKLVQMFGSLNGLNVGVLGLTYKPGTSTIRRSGAIEIVQALVKGRAKVKAYDPKAEFSIKDTGVEFERVKDAASVADSSDALLILTAWPEFKDLDFGSLKARMNYPVIVDGMNMLNVEKLAGEGITCIGVGRGHQITPIREIMLRRESTQVSTSHQKAVSKTRA